MRKKRNTTTIEDNIILMNAIDDFIEDTGYKLKPIARDVEPGDLFDVDEETGYLINYGPTDDIVNKDEFKGWFLSQIEKGDY